jgi:hypothetical protein
VTFRDVEKAAKGAGERVKVGPEWGEAEGPLRRNDGSGHEELKPGTIGEKLIDSAEGQVM